MDTNQMIAEREWFRLDGMMSRIAWNECPPLPCKILCEHTNRCVVRDMVNMYWNGYVMRN